MKVSQAVNIICSSLKEQPKEYVSLSNGLGRVLAEDVCSLVDSPPHDVAMINGYAIRATDITYLPAILTIVGTTSPSQPCDVNVDIGHAIKIFTGASIPIGTDTVIAEEEVTQMDEDYILIDHLPQKQNTIYYQGADIKSGSTILTKGDIITARDIGFMTAMGISYVEVHRKPRIALITAGNELSQPGENKANNTISASTPTLSNIITAYGADALNIGIAEDNRHSIRNALKQARGADLLITTGGLSSAANNLMLSALSYRQKAPQVLDISIGGGTTILITQHAGTPIISFPGNPAECLISAVLFLVPAIYTLLGVNMNQYRHAKQYGKLTRNLDCHDEEVDYLHATLSHDEQGSLLVSPFSAQDTLEIPALAQSDCLIIIEDRGKLTKGELVPFIPLTGSIYST